MTEIRLGLAVLAGILALATLSATASAGTMAATQVTIKERGGDFSGKVKSEDSPRCTASRKVVLFRKKPGKDKRVATDMTEDDGSWSTGNTGEDSGKFYAKAIKDPDCETGRSKTLEL